MNLLDKLSQAFNPIINNGVKFGFNFLIGLLVLLIGYMIAKFISGGVKKLFNALNLEKYMDKLREVDLFAGIHITLAEIMQKVVFWLLMFVIIMVSMDLIGLDMVSNGINSALYYLPRLLSALVFFVFGTFLANAARTLIKGTCDSMGIASGNFLSGIVYYFLLLMIAIVALNQAGIATDMLSDNIQIILTLSMLGLALGFGLSSRDLFSNMLGGYYGKDKFSIGQIIEVDNSKGEIVKIDSTSVTLDLGDKRMVIPFKQLADSKVIIHN